MPSPLTSAWPSISRAWRPCAPCPRFRRVRGRCRVRFRADGANGGGAARERARAYFLLLGYWPIILNPHLLLPFLSDTVTPPTAALDDHLRAFVAGFETAFQTCLMSGGGAGTAAVGPSPTQQQPPAFTTPPPPQAPPLPTPPTQTPPEDAAAFFEAAGGGAGVPVAPKAPPFTSTVPLPVTATGHVDVAALQRKFFLRA